MELHDIYKSHNVNALLYHIVFPVKYRRKVLWFDQIDLCIKETCKEIEDRFEIEFHEIGADIDHIHFLVQSVPMLSPKQIVTTIKSITVREVFKEHEQIIKQFLWKRELWSDGYYLSISPRWNANTIERYVRNQWMATEYKRLHVSETQTQLGF